MNQSVQPTRSFTGVIVKLISIGVGGGAIFAIRAPAGRRIRVRVPWNVLATRPALGETWRTDGQFERTVYGSQLIADMAEVVKPSEHEIVQFLGYNPAFPELDSRSSRTLSNRMRNALRYSLDTQDLNTLIELGGLSPARSATLCEQWKDFWLNAALCKDLRCSGLPPELATRMSRYWGASARDRLRNNPYILISLCPWSTVDSAARLGYASPLNSPARLVGAVEATCWEFERRGNTAVEVKEMCAVVAIKLGTLALAEEAISLAESENRVFRLEMPDGTQLLQAAGLFRIESAILRKLSEASTTHVGSAASSRMETCDTPDTNIRGRISRSRISIVHAAGWSTSDIIAQSRRPGVAVLHIVGDTTNRASQCARSEKVQAVALTDVMSDAVALHNSYEEIHVHGSEGMSVPMVAKLLSRLPPAASLSLLVRSRYQSTAGVGSALSMLEGTGMVRISNLGLPPSSLDRDLHLALADVSLGRLPIGRPVISSSKSISNVRLIQMVTWRDILDETIAQYYQLASSGGVRIALPTRALCRKVNSVLHGESAIAAVQQDVTVPKVQLAGDDNGVTGEPIVCDTPFPNLGVPKCALGRLTCVHEKPFYTVRRGEVVAAKAEVEFEVGGTVQLVQDELRSLTLAYALPVSRMQFLATPHVLIPLVSNRIVDRFWLHNAMASATKSITFIGELDALQKSITRLAARKPLVYGAPAKLVRQIAGE